MGKKTKNLVAELQQFTGDLERYRHSLNPQVIYTPGIKYLADEAGAYWLLDSIALYLKSKQMREAIKQDERLAHLQFWYLEINDDKSANLYVVADSDEKPAIAEVIPYTDFPLERIAIWAGCDSQYWTLYLPSEH